MNTIAEVNPEETIPLSHRADRETVERLTVGRDRIVAELAKVIVGQQEVIEQILIALLAYYLHVKRQEEHERIQSGGPMGQVG